MLGALVLSPLADDFIERSINKDRKFLDACDPARDRAVFGAKWRERQSGAKSEVGAFEPNYEGSPLVAGPDGGRCSAGDAHSFAARPGHYLAPQPLSTGANVFDALDGGFSLLALDADPDGVAAFRQAANTLQVPLTVVQDGRAEGRERYEAELVLVHPDQFVAEAWSGPVGDARAALSRAAGGTAQTG